MQYLQNIEYEIKIIIFKYVNSLLNLVLTCRNWSVIAKNPYAKTEWLIVRYGKAHALFHALRLGPTFIDITVCQTLIARNVAIPRYFIQRLLMPFGKHHQRLIIEDVSRLDADEIRAFQQSLCISIKHNKLSNANEDLSSKRNYMESFYFITASLYVINYVLKKNLKHMILNKRFTPLQPSIPK